MKNGWHFKGGKMLENHDSEDAESLTVLMGMQIEVLKWSHDCSGANIFSILEEIDSVAKSRLEQANITM